MIQREIATALGAVSTDRPCVCTLCVYCVWVQINHYYSASYSIDK